MFDHVKFGVSDYAASKAFFLKALEPLGVAVASEGAPAYGIELVRPNDKCSLCLFETDAKPAPLHLAFTAETRSQVDAFHRAALGAGGNDNGAPGLRAKYHANYYAAFVIGPDGHNIEAVCHAPDASGPCPDPRPESTMIRGSCHCGSVQWQFSGVLESATACNCTACRRYGALWAYDHEGEGIVVTGPTQAYVRAESLGFHFCPACGCVAYWRSLQPDAQGRRRVGVNLRLTEPEAIGHLPIDHFDGLQTWEDLPRDGRCIRDLWF